MKEAYVNWNAGVCRVIEYPSQRLIAEGLTMREAADTARRQGYSVRVYNQAGSEVLPPLNESPT